MPPECMMQEETLKARNCKEAVNEKQLKIGTKIGLGKKFLSIKKCQNKEVRSTGFGSIVFLLNI
jgi:hypothetical protein